MKLLNLVFLMVILLPAYSQNLILNGDFENYTNCPDLSETIQVCKDWRNPNYTTSPDYYNNCDSSGYLRAKFGGPLNGNGYCGIMMFSANTYSYKEYIQGKLIKPMERGRRYRISMQILLDSNSNYYSDLFSIGFSYEPSVWSRKINGYAVIFSDRIVTFTCDSCLKIKNRWTTIQAEFTSKGSEQFINIGYFKNLYNRRKHKIMLRSHTFNSISIDAIEQAYYYIDNVVVEEIK